MDFNLTGLAYLLISLVLALTLHEFAHAWMSNFLGDRTAKNEGRLSINPAVHIDPLMTLFLPLMLIIFQSPVIFGAAKPVPFNPWAVKYGKYGAALVAVAGPLMNMLIAILFAVCLAFFPVSTQIIPFFISMISINVAFAVFNMIPIPPLDGSRVLYAVAPAWLRDSMDKLENNGLVIIFAVLFIASPIILPFLAAVNGAIMQILVPGLTGSST